jgi:hypothetical protein
MIVLNHNLYEVRAKLVLVDSAGFCSLQHVIGCSRCDDSFLTQVCEALSLHGSWGLQLGCLHTWPLIGSVACIVVVTVIGEVERHHVGEQRSMLLRFRLHEIQMMSPVRAHQSLPNLILIWIENLELCKCVAIVFGTWNLKNLGWMVRLHKKRQGASRNLSSDR